METQKSGHARALRRRALDRQFVSFRPGLGVRGAFETYARHRFGGYRVSDRVSRRYMEMVKALYMVKSVLLASAVLRRGVICMRSCATELAWGAGGSTRRWLKG